jgi:hypothetical protein
MILAQHTGKDTNPAGDDTTITLSDIVYDPLPDGIS